MALLWIVGWSATAAGQDMMFVTDNSEDVVLRMVDFDDDGIFSSTETNVYYDDASPEVNLSIPNHLAQLGDAILVLDGGTVDAILALVDTNGDGDANDSGEASAFYDDTGTGPVFSTPNGIAVSDDGVVYVSDDGSSVKAILRFEDLNDDGDALDDGESAVFYDDTALGAGPIDDPESVAIGSDGAIYVGDTATGAVYRLVDSNDDGDALDDGEATLYYDGIAGPALADVDSLGADSVGGIYAIDEDDGTVVYLLDINGDGDANDTDEGTTFYDGLAPGASVSDPNDAIVIADGTLLVADGSLDSIVLLEDADADGFIAEDTEVTVVFEDGGFLSTPSGVVWIPDAAVPLPPTIESILPDTGPIDGGTPVLITGTALETTFALTFGGVPAPEFTVIDDFSVSAITPAAAVVGAVDVTLEAADGSVTAVEGFTYEPSGVTVFVRGDVDASGTFGIEDAIQLLEVLFKNRDIPCLDVVDVDDNGELTLLDGLHLLEYIFLGGPPPAAPFPLAGPDPTPGAPGCERSP